MRKQKNKNLRQERGITLIALVVTIVVLLILAAVSIATLTGENGILKQASKAEKETDIAQTKEQIKLELIGTYDENKTNYTNQDVINAVKEITGKDVAENTTTVASKKGNDVDISDLWVKKTEGEAEKVECPACNGTGKCKHPNACIDTVVECSEPISIECAPGVYDTFDFYNKMRCPDCGNMIDLSGFISRRLWWLRL